ncbi:hypothetical protein EOL32_14465, partial [Citrobacter freundii]
VSEISTKRPIQQAHALTINNASKLNKQLQNADAIEAMGMLSTLMLPFGRGRVSTSFGAGYSFSKVES